MPLAEDEVQSHAVAPAVDVPAKETSALLAQTVWLAPALTIGASVMVIIRKSLVGLQVP